MKKLVVVFASIVLLLPAAAFAKKEKAHKDEATHKTHADHPHKHGEKCGHTAQEHEDHMHYMHDGHAHFTHTGDRHVAGAETHEHYDECLQSN